MTPIDVLWWSAAALAVVVVMLAFGVTVRILIACYEVWEQVKRDVYATSLLQKIEQYWSYCRDYERASKARDEALEKRIERLERKTYRIGGPS